MHIYDFISLIVNGGAPHKHTVQYTYVRSSYINVCSDKRISHCIWNWLTHTVQWSSAIRGTKKLWTKALLLNVRTLSVPFLFSGRRTQRIAWCRGNVMSLFQLIFMPSYHACIHNTHSVLSCTGGPDKIIAADIKMFCCCLLLKRLWRAWQLHLGRTMNPSRNLWFNVPMLQMHEMRASAKQLVKSKSMPI